MLHRVLGVCAHAVCARAAGPAQASGCGPAPDGSSTGTGPALLRSPPGSSPTVEGRPAATAPPSSDTGPRSAAIARRVSRKPDHPRPASFHCPTRPLHVSATNSPDAASDAEGVRRKRDSFTSDGLGVTTSSLSRPHGRSSPHSFLPCGSISCHQQPTSGSTAGQEWSVPWTVPGAPSAFRNPGQAPCGTTSHFLGSETPTCNRPRPVEWCRWFACCFAFLLLLIMPLLVGPRQ